MQDKGTCHLSGQSNPAKTITALPWCAKQSYQSESLVPESRRCVALRNEVWRVDHPELVLQGHARTGSLTVSEQ